MNNKDIIIDLTGIELLEFTGVNEENINFIRETFPGNVIVIRGNSLILKSSNEEFDTLKKLFDELIFLQKKQGKVLLKDVKLIIDLLDAGENSENFKEKYGISNGEINDIILFKKSDYIKPLTKNQFEYFRKVKENDIVFAIGPAGTGKTYLAVAFAVSALKNKSVNKIVLARPAVEAGESLGFLPGDISDKVDPYLRPLYDSLEDMIPFEKLKTYLERNTIEIVPLAYMRGRTLNNSFVILDEAQNSTALQMKMFLTRLGVNSKAIITGDITQIDLPKKELSGLVKIQEILKNVEGIEFIYFDKNDAVRHKLVKDIINAYEKYNEKI